VGEDNVIDITNETEENDDNNDNYDDDAADEDENDDVDGFIVNDEEDDDNNKDRNNNEAEDEDEDNDYYDENSLEDNNRTRDLLGYNESSIYFDCYDKSLQKTMKQLQLENDFTGRLSYTLDTAFPVYILYLISSALDPDFVEDIYNLPNEIVFKLANSRIENYLGGYKDSQVGSTLWKGVLKKDINELLKIRVQEAPLILSGNTICDGCRRKTKQNAVLFQIPLYGYRYNSDAFNQSMENLDFDSNTQEVKKYNFGTTCASRVKLYHRAHHRKYYDLIRVCKRIRYWRNKLKDDKDDKDDDEGEDDDDEEYDEDGKYSEHRVEVKSAEEKEKIIENVLNDERFMNDQMARFKHLVGEVENFAFLD